MSIDIDSLPMDSPEVGSYQKTEFRLDEHKKQRIAVLPEYTSEKELSPTPELLAAAEGGDDAAARKIEHLGKIRAALINGTKRRYKTVLPFELDGEPGYLWIKTINRYVHFLNGHGYVECRREDFEREGRMRDGLSPCCVAAAKSKASGQFSKRPYQEGEESIEKDPHYGVLVLVYDTFMNHQINELEIKNLQVPRKIDDKHLITFSYKVFPWRIKPYEMRTFKETHDKFPPIGHDYEVWKTKENNFTKFKSSPCNESTWFNEGGPEFVKKILRDHRGDREKLGGWFSRRMTLDQLEEAAYEDRREDASTATRRNVDAMMSMD